MGDTAGSTLAKHFCDGLLQLRRWKVRVGRSWFGDCLQPISNGSSRSEESCQYHQAMMSGLRMDRDTAGQVVTR